MSPLLNEDVSTADLLTLSSSETTQVEEEAAPPPREATQQRRERKESTTKRSALDYVFWRVLGEGSFSTVFLATDIHSGKEFAIKVCEKRHIIKERKVEYVKREKDVLNIVNSNPCTTAPFFVKLYHSFQDGDRLYFALSYAKNGELLTYISNGKQLDERSTQFYAAEILRALEHLHHLGIVHRDLKPENIIFNENMHILLTDFGSAKILEHEPSGSRETPLPRAHRPRGGSFVGTAQYVSPELLNGMSVSHASDLWALGCIIYQMVAGLPPFVAKSEPEIFQKIRKLDFSFPDNFEPIAKDLVQKLLVLDTSSRLGASDVGRYISVRSHELFGGVDFENLYQETPPLLPLCPVGESEAQGDAANASPPVGPGLDNRQLSRLLGLSLYGSTPSPVNKPSRKVSIAAILKSPEEIRRRLELQQQKNEWHSVVEGNLILKLGIVNKRKGLLTRKRVLILTSGPHLFYADPDSKALKGEISWSEGLHVEAKNFKIFYIHTPERTFRWEEPEGNALIWCESIEQVHGHVFGEST